MAVYRLPVDSPRPCRRASKVVDTSLVPRFPFCILRSSPTKPCLLCREADPKLADLEVESIGKRWHSRTQPSAGSDQFQGLPQRPRAIPAESEWARFQLLKTCVLPSTVSCTGVIPEQSLAPTVPSAAYVQCCKGWWRQEGSLRSRERAATPRGWRTFFVSLSVFLGPG